MQTGSMFSTLGRLWSFWLGSVAVVVGVILHLPMFLMSRHDHYRMAGMPMDRGMLCGMFLIVAGFGAAAYGLIPQKASETRHQEIAPPEDAPLTSAHWVQIAILAVALVIDVMKAATLGFVTPGMRLEYGVSFAEVARVPFAGLLGTTVGSLLWGYLADIYGRRASILLAAVVFLGTAICGAMPSINWNIFMCFLMGLGAGGMLPVAYALLAEIMPTRHRGWCLVLVGGVGSVGGYFATSALSAILQPTFGWRILWLINMPIALILVLLSPYLQESARFLQSMGRSQEARETLTRFGIALDQGAGVRTPNVPFPAQSTALVFRPLLGISGTLALIGLCVGFVNFGVLLWLPGSLLREGRSIGSASLLLAQSTLLAAPTVLLVAWLYSAWSSRRTLWLTILITTAGLGLLLLRGTTSLRWLTSPVLPVTLLIVGTNGIISVLLPYAAESYPLRIRGRATGVVAGFSKAGGLVAQILGIAALVPALDVAAGCVAVPCLLSMALLASVGQETHKKDLRELEASPQSIHQA